MGAGTGGGGQSGAHEAGGAPYGGGRALCPHGQMVGPPGVFSVPEILKYPNKNHTSFSGHLENFYFQGIFITRIIQKIDIKNYFCFI